MKSLIYILIASLLVSCGSTTHILSPNSQAAKELDQKSHADTYTILTTGGSQMKAVNIQVKQDSTYWMEAETMSQRHIPNSHIKSIHRINRGKGALKKFGVIGGLTIIGIFFGDKDTGGSYLSEAGLASGLGSIAILSAFLKVYVIGSKEIYKIDIKSAQ